MGSEPRNAASSPGATTTSPPGFSRSLAILATVFDVPTPMEHPREVVWRTASWTRRAWARQAPASPSRSR